MQTITTALEYDFDNGDFEASAVQALLELTRLAGAHVQGTPRVNIATTVKNEDWGDLRYNISTAQNSNSTDPFDFVVDAVDAVMPRDAEWADITVSFQLEDSQAVLLKGAWSDTLPRLTITEAGQ